MGDIYDFITVFVDGIIEQEQIRDFFRNQATSVFSEKRKGRKA